MLKIFLFTLLIVAAVFAQDFPPPQNFTLEHSYTFLENWFYLFWNTPDTSTAVGTLGGYLLYRNYSFLDSLSPLDTTFTELNPPPISENDALTSYYLAAYYLNVDGLSEYTDTLSHEFALATDGRFANVLPNSNKLSIYPNPSNSVIVISFVSGLSEYIEVNVYTISGRYVDTIYAGPSEQGKNAIHYSANGLNSGMYLIVLNSGSSNVLKKFLIVK